MHGLGNFHNGLSLPIGPLLPETLGPSQKKRQKECKSQRVKRRAPNAVF